jgi:hypothetical protein
MMRRSDERLHLGRACVVTDGDDGDLALLDERIEGADAAAIARAHAVDLVHDENHALGPICEVNLLRGADDLPAVSGGVRKGGVD